MEKVKFKIPKYLWTAVIAYNLPKLQAAMEKETKSKVKEAKLQREFWKEWYTSNELGRLELVKTLALPSREVKPKDLYDHHCAVLINSYLTDLSEFLEELG